MTLRMHTITVIRTGLLSLIILALSACSGIQVSQDYEQGYDFSKLKTFAWKPNNNHEYGVKDNDLLKERIVKAIENNLIAKHYQMVDSKTPDFYVSYDVSVEQKITGDSFSSGIAIGHGGYGSFGSIGIGTGTDIRAYDQGKLNIDITDAKTDKLIWRGISTQTVSEHSTPEETTENVNETVEKVLAQFPPR
jgi:hypothetical protein